jgi:hypothetical protein
MVPPLISPKLVASLELSAPTVKDYPIDDFKMEARVGFFL